MHRSLLSLFLLLVISGFGLAQKAVNDNAAKNSCSVGTFSFPCPEGYQILNGKGTDAPYLAVEQKRQVLVFAFAPAERLSETELVKQTLAKVFQAVNGSDYLMFESKDSNDFWGDSKWSQYEVKKFAKALLDRTKNRGFHTQYVYLDIKGKQVLAGFTYDPTLREPPDAWYARWRGGGNGNATSALHMLISSLTNEERRQEVPGGPPPAKKP